MDYQAAPLRNPTKRKKDFKSVRSQNMFLPSNGVEIGKATSSCANDNANDNVSHSSASVDECSSEESIDINRDLFATKKQKLNQMHAEDGTVAQGNVNVCHFIPPNLVSQDSAENTVKTTQKSRTTINTTATGPELAMDDKELKIARRRQSNKESARRSRLRKQEQLNKLRELVEKLKAESFAMKDELLNLYKECDKLKNENGLLMKEVKRIYEPNANSFIMPSLPVQLMCESIRSSENSTHFQRKDPSKYYNFRQQGPW